MSWELRGGGKVKSHCLVLSHRSWGPPSDWGLLGPRESHRTPGLLRRGQTCCGDHVLCLHEAGIGRDSHWCSRHVWGTLCAGSTAGPMTSARVGQAWCPLLQMNSIANFCIAPHFQNEMNLFPVLWEGWEQHVSLVSFYPISSQHLPLFQRPLSWCGLFLIFIYLVFNI